VTLLASRTWVDVCLLDKLIPGRGVCALVGPFQVAVFRIAPPRSAGRSGPGEEIYALSNYDPFSRAFVLSRGIVGSRAERLKVASPVYKQSFDLETGVCLDDATVSVPTFEVRVVDGTVQVASP
jgi:nitrite reductase (NADH) small subunit